MRIANITTTSGATYLFKVDEDGIVKDAIPNLMGPRLMPNIYCIGEGKNGSTPVIEFGITNKSKLQKAMREKLIGLKLEDAIAKLPARKAWEVESLFTNEDFKKISEYNKICRDEEA